jgi:hypothetical protein
MRERERDNIIYMFINKRNERKSPGTTLVLFLPGESLRPKQRGLVPADELNY